MNKVILMGRLTKDPEMRYTSMSNVGVCHFTLAVDRRFTKQGEEKQADFIPVVAWEKQADFCSKYYTKGQRVVIIGRMQVRTWDDNEGKKRYVTEVIAEETYFADNKKDENAAYKAQTDQTQNNDTAAGFYPVEDSDELPF